MSVNIAIDGPSGAGKSTLSKALAARLGYIYVDTGAIYRCVGLYVLDNGIDVDDAEAVSACLEDINIAVEYVDGTQRMILNCIDVSERIRLPQVSTYASKVSAIGTVRSFLLGMQRRFAAEYNCIMDGRDIGTVVLPDAQVKIFLSASSQVRARRRHLELVAKGSKVTYEEVLRDMIERDTRDSSRAQAPLKAADDAILVDTSDIDFDASLELLLGIIRERLA